MASASSIAVTEYTKARNGVTALIVNQLKSVLRSEGQLVSGTKAVLQQRVENRLQEYYSRNDVSNFRRLSNLIQAPTGTASSYSSPVPSMSFVNHSSHTPQTSSYGIPPSWGNHANGHSTVQLNFKDSPFYETITPLSSVQTLKVVEGTRYSLEFVCRIPTEWAAKFERTNPDRESYRILLLGASDPVSPFLRQDIAFPLNFEVKVNHTEVRSNWKGLKNKPGSTRPADVTDFFSKTGNRDNTILITYAMTTKKHYVRLDLVKAKSLDSLVQKLKAGKTISKDQVLRDMQNKAKDSDIVATSTVMSLKCPLSYTRLQNPCRGSQCNHNQCFDALSYLQLQQQAPTWICPICNKLATFDNLQIDQYVADIVQSVPEDVEKVTITPEGEWSRVKEDDNGNQGRTGVKSEDSDDEDIIEVSNPASSRPSISRPAISSTPALQTLNSSPISTRNVNNKRAHDVVDLTLDSDDDAPTPKRTNAPTLQHPIRLPFSNASSTVSANSNRPPSFLPRVSLPTGNGRTTEVSSNRPWGSASQPQPPRRWAPD